MGDRERYAPGTFCWADLGTTDAAAAKAFYTGVFGWEATDEEREGGSGPYTMFKVDGRDVAALYEMGEEERANLTPHWSSYISVEDVDAATAKARELGAEVLAEPLDVAEAGRMAVLRDPTGAIVHLWQPGEQVGAGRVNDPGCMVWNELASPEPEKAGAFYSELLGWKAEKDESGYATVLQASGGINGGIRPVQDGEPPQWLVYFSAESCEETLEAVREGGGTVTAGPIEIHVGRMAIVADPQGATFAVFEGQADP